MSLHCRAHGLTGCSYWAGLSVAHRDTEGHTPLHWAAYQNHESVARLLISLGADVRSVDDEGLTPMHWASLKVRPFPV